MTQPVRATLGDVLGFLAGARFRLLFNDPALAARLTTALRCGLGDANVVPIEPTTASEDFGVFGRVAGVPSIQLRVGAVEPGEFAKAKAAGKTVPGPHSPLFAPDRERTIRTGVTAFTLSVLELLGRPAGASQLQFGLLCAARCRNTDSAAAGMTNCGLAVGVFRAWGVIWLIYALEAAPQFVVLEGGSGAVEDLVAGTDRGLLVTRFWYIRPVNPQIVLLTGLTRNGVWLVEKGKIVSPVNNFRFNDSPVNLLKNVEALSAAVPAGNAVVPAVRAHDFNFTSKSDAA